MLNSIIPQTSASCLNQVEIWFGIFTKKVLKGASFNSTGELTKVIAEFTILTTRMLNFLFGKKER